MSNRTIVVLSDMQIPYHNARFVEAVMRFIKAYKPDVVASVGDEVDFPQVSRWSRRMEGEYVGNLQEHVTAGVGVLERLREVHSGPIHISRSNHMDRPLNYVRQYAPGLLGLQALTIPNLLEFKRLGITYHETPWEIAPGWLMAHGDEGGLNRTSGGTALGLARKWGRSVVCGHTHKLGLQHEHRGYGLRTTDYVYGFEVGNLMNLKRADYLKSGYANWQNGFGVMHVDGRHVTPVPVYIHPGGSFTVDRTVYKPASN